MVGPWMNYGQRRGAVFLQQIRSQQPIRKRSALSSSKADTRKSTDPPNGPAAVSNLSATPDALDSQALERLGKLLDSTESWDHRSSPSSESRYVKLKQLTSLDDSCQCCGRRMRTTESLVRASFSFSYSPHHAQYEQSRHYYTKTARKPDGDSCKRAKRVAVSWAPVNHLPIMHQHIRSDQDARAIVKLWKEKRQMSQTYEEKLKMLSFLKTRMFEKHEFTITGSSANGFGFNNCDVDLSVELRNGMLPLMQTSPTKILCTMQARMFGSDRFRKPMIIRAIVPILKFSYVASAKQRPMEVEVNASGKVAILNTQLLYSYSRMDARVAPLVGAWKHWASTMQVNDACRGLLSSYSLTLMVIHFLQTVDVVPVLHNLVPEFESGQGFGTSEKLLLPRWSSSNSQDIGSLFRNMLRFYSDFDFRKYCIAVRQGKAVEVEQAIETDPDMEYSSRLTSRDTWGLINIQEPFNLTNTARAVQNEARFNEVKNALQDSSEIAERKGGIRSLFGNVDQTSE